MDPAKTSRTANQEKEASPRFLVFKRSHGDFKKVSPFLINKVLYGTVGELKSIRRTRDGLIVETKSHLQSSRLLNLKKLGEFGIDVRAHKTLNISRGVVFCIDLLNCTEEEICEEPRCN